MKIIRKLEGKERFEKKSERQRLKWQINYIWLWFQIGKLQFEIKKNPFSSNIYIFI